MKVIFEISWGRVKKARTWPAIREDIKERKRIYGLSFYWGWLRVFLSFKGDFKKPAKQENLPQLFEA